MSLLFNTPPSALWYQSWKPVKRSGSFGKPAYSSRLGVKAFIFNPMEDPIVKEALKEPVAFMGGMFAGVLRLDLNDDPLKEWLTRTVEASGISEDEIVAEGSQPEEASEQIEID